MTSTPTFSQDIIKAAENACDLCGVTPYSDMRIFAEQVAKVAIAAERQATEDRIALLLKDPSAVRVNYLRGEIACQALIDEAVQAERNRCAWIAAKYDCSLMAYSTEDEARFYHAGVLDASVGIHDLISPAPSIQGEG